MRIRLRMIYIMHATATRAAYDTKGAQMCQVMYLTKRAAGVTNTELRWGSGG